MISIMEHSFQCHSLGVCKHLSQAGLCLSQGWCAGYDDFVPSSMSDKALSLACARPFGVTNPTGYRPAGLPKSALVVDGPNHSKAEDLIQ